MKKNLLSILALSFGISSFAQIIHNDITDITLTSTSPRESFSIDINSDGTEDYSMFAVDTTITVPVKGIAMQMAGSNKTIGSLQTLVTGQVLGVTAQPIGTNINSSLNFTSPSSSLLFPGGALSVSSSVGSAGEFEGNIDQYIAIEFDISGATHYGWIRVNTADNSASVIIKDYAYESTANTAIRAGDNGSGFTTINEKELANASVFFGNNELNINGITGNYNVSVVDLLGKSISNSTITNNASINLGNVNNGIYLVQITKGNSVVTKKVYNK